MAGVIGAVRRTVTAPSLSRVTPEGRGFPGGDTEVARRLGAIPQAVVCGFEWGIADGSPAETAARLALVAPEARGFAYEGATMACVIRDAVSPARHRTRALLDGAGRPHILLNHIGIGFAMARLPRAAWRRAVPRLTEAWAYPRMSWLAVDGYGFDRAYFDNRRWIDSQYRPRRYAWEGDAEYFPRAVDQGVGRALWFVHGGRPQDVASAVHRFAFDRRADLWSGVGLAATFAGGATASALSVLRDDAGRWAGHLCQGAVFAAKARHLAGHVPEHTTAATRVLTGRTVEAAAAFADDCGEALGPAVPGSPVYEQWRTAVRRRSDRFSASQK